VVQIKKDFQYSVTHKHIYAGPAAWWYMIVDDFLGFSIFYVTYLFLLRHVLVLLCCSIWVCCRYLCEHFPLHPTVSGSTPCTSFFSACNTVCTGYTGGTYIDSCRLHPLIVYRYVIVAGRKSVKFRSTPICRLDPHTAKWPKIKNNYGTISTCDELPETVKAHFSHYIQMISLNIKCEAIK